MISPIGETKLNSGFTIIELLLVIIIVGVVLALAGVNFSKGYSRFLLDKTADDLLNVSRWAQAMAIGQERIYALSFSDDRRSYDLIREKMNEDNGEVIVNQDSFEPVNGALGRMHSIPDSIQVELDNSQIDYYPDGTIDEATIQLNSPQAKEELSTTDVRGMMTKVEK